ncbi:MAG: hypothetical protein B7Y12_00540 [Rhizobiales bacterium 24-66-13]|jgi:hypothetical protein|nr:MAG: hypothetical protein B7Z41_01270 [Rhizobiales bacterium 12-66-7]OYY14001.1 MAG: hypothetical protein B7Y70_00025 [Rhizobiales bacterium 35-68-8]OYZ83092.1 MAG: hypothetical protein B7Y12_00540 [Rhizobiales bacterium 24-66-13]OZB12023.1 MAG: hypothetical protein B7X67_01125 [Rhizobiales bacterium 39-66-18]HQS45646.1 hypothetical protein [Xanthobacteraceae bacterium]
MVDIDKVRVAALRAIAPLKAADNNTPAGKDLLFGAHRTDASRTLPPYHLVYFLLVDLLGFRNLGQFEKISWSVPVEFNGKAFLVEHRKFGLGIFAGKLPEDEADAAEIAKRITRAVKAAKPYFTWRAEEAAKASELNVINRAPALFGRFEFFAALYAAKIEEAERRKDEYIKTDLSPHSWTIRHPATELRQEAEHYAISTIESFFSWTEHVFILIAILLGGCATGEEVRQLARAEWETKFKAALDITEPTTKGFYDGLIHIRRQVRNFVAHGSFGKEGEAFAFHSRAGAVPMRMVDERRGPHFQFGVGAGYADEVAINLLLQFVDHVWSGPREPARLYIQEHQLDLILTMAKDGSYARSMASVDEMKAFADHLSREWERAANMDF